MRPKSSSHAAFSLVEVTLALGVAAFCLISVFGLLPVGLNSNRSSTLQTTGINVLTAVCSDLRNTPKQNTTSTRYKIDLTSTQAQTIYLREDGSPLGLPGTDAPSADARYRVTLTVTQLPTATVKRTTNVAVLMTWPGIADPKASVNPATNFLGSTATLIALDRN